ncbi:MAG: hypothetical protein ABIV48_07510 [Pyrinomonadaceae bacterium]
MWHARTKHDLIIEVWEKLDCETVGAAEIEAIESVIADQYGAAAVESPMTIARQLADEGADLRHSEIMDLFVERTSERPYDAALRNIVNIADLQTALSSIRNLENLRRKYKADNDKEGLRHIRSTALRGKEIADKMAASGSIDPSAQNLNGEIAQWFRIWLETPEVFDSWVELRQRSGEFAKLFGSNKGN